MSVAGPSQLASDSTISTSPEYQTIIGRARRDSARANSKRQLIVLEREIWRLRLMSIEAIKLVSWPERSTG
jgi:hypothetical protein